MGCLQVVHFYSNTILKCKYLCYFINNGTPHWFNIYNIISMHTIYLNLIIKTIKYNETYHINKGVIVSISNTASIITLAFPKSNNNNNNKYITYI